MGKDTVRLLTFPSLVKNSNAVKKIFFLSKRLFHKNFISDTIFDFILMIS
jgi:hypothetical protein